MPQFVLSVEPHASAADLAVVQDGLNHLNIAVTGHTDYRPLAIFVRDGTGAIRGGILGDVWATWLHITYLWVEEPLRGQGYGAALLQAFEAEGRACGCQHAYLETFDFQAPDFYQKFGYEIFATLADRPPGHAYYYLRKPLG